MKDRLIVILVTFTLYSHWLFSISFASPTPNEDHHDVIPSLVFRGSKTGPDVVFHNGFLPPAKELGNLEGYHMETHVLTKIDYSNYVSTTRNLDVARYFAAFKMLDNNWKQTLSVVFEQKSPIPFPDSWVYIIKPDSSFINVHDTIYGEGQSEYEPQEEFAALHGIDRSRIIGVYSLEDNNERKITFNPHYNHAYNSQVAGKGYKILDVEAFSADEKDSLKRQVDEILSTAAAENAIAREVGHGAQEPERWHNGKKLSEFITEFQARYPPHLTSMNQESPKPAGSHGSHNQPTSHVLNEVGGRKEITKEGGVKVAGDDEEGGIEEIKDIEDLEDVRDEVGEVEGVRRKTGRNGRKGSSRQRPKAGH
ncbi:hypothetical protein DCS_05967 [Drechmeria coniospora]|uniref:Pierisin-like domain-containing protein n=1 Tax=Drechmeria coniospora TaxID=98403 RepID=A0A151GAA7_DRECN|nr:hypothetical protein DCS_05967 [Drechmeria coniospora]KYK54017.1 hypothetical protein DCS_05967 [Drechmeria coniospora]